MSIHIPIVLCAIGTCIHSTLCIELKRKILIGEILSNFQNIYTNFINRNELQHR